jgi:hypothetical protein
MRPYVYYLPAIVFGLIAVSTGRINFQDPKLVKHPGGFWTPFRLFDDNEWTEAGLAARRRFLRSVVLALTGCVVTWIVVLALFGP